MKSYVIVTDSTADLPAEMVASLGVKVAPLGFSFGDEHYLNYPDHRDLGIKEFYARLRNGEISTTTLVNAATFTEYFEPILESGEDILYIGFSSELSGTYSSGLVAAKELKEKYPDAKIECVDTLSASVGEGLLVYHAVMQKRAGKSLEEVKQWLLDNRLKVCQWITVDDLNHLKRGGRISTVSATLGSALGVKPLIHMDNEGRLIPMEKVRGRKKAIQALLDHMETSIVNPEDQMVFISHGDCPEDAEMLASMIKEKLKVKDVFCGYMGPVIGAHTGHGALAVFYMGSER